MPSSRSKDLSVPKVIAQSQTNRRPVAPPAYRPQPTPLVLQRKTAAHQTGLQSKPNPVAPAAYRPQPVPKVLQTKVVAGKQSPQTQKIRPLVTPSVRPTPKRVVQPKAASTSIQMAEDQHRRTSSATLYTHTHTRPTSQINPRPQGPHTVAHTLVTFGFATATEDEDWDDLIALWGLHVPSIDEIKAIVATEKSGSMGSTMQGQYDRYYLQYQQLYEQAEKCLNKRQDFATASRCIRELMELHPYQTYAWKTGRAAARTSTAGKGEGHYFKQWKSTGSLENLMKLLDLSRCRFVDKEGFKQFVSYRLELANIGAEVIREILDQI